MAIGEFAEVQRQVVFRYFVIRAHDSPAQQAPERFNRLRVNAASDVFVVFVRDEIVLVAHLIEMPVAETLIGRDQRNIFRDGLFDEIVIGAEIGLFHHLAHDICLYGRWPR